METIDSGIEKVSVYRPNNVASAEVVEEAYDIDLSPYDIDEFRVSDPQENYMDLATRAVNGLIQDTDNEDFFGIFISSDVCGQAEASKLSSILNEEHEVEFSTDGSSMSDSRMLQEASSQHTARARPREYSIAVSSFDGNPRRIQGSAAIAYLIGDDPSIKLSKQGGIEGVHSDSNNDFEENLASMKGAMDGFIEEATEFTYHGTDVKGHNSRLVHPDNIDYALFNIGEVEKRELAAARGYGRVARQSGLDLGFEMDPSERDPEEYINNLLESDQFQEFYEKAVEPVLELERVTGTVSPGSLGLQRASILENGGNDGVIMVGSLGLGGRNAEVHAEKIIDNPKYVENKDELNLLNVNELQDLEY